MRPFLTVFIIHLMLLSALTTVNAEVFSLAPFGSKGAGAGGEITDAMGGVKLWSEPVVVNGIKCKMHLRLLKHELEECYLTLKKYFPGSVFKSSPGALLIEFKHKDGSLERIYLVELDGLYPVIQFSMTFPKGLPKTTQDWPVDLPIPPGSTVQSTIAMPDRDVTYGTFTTSLPKDAAMSAVSGSMTSNGWTNLKQGVFIKDSPLSILLVSFSQDDKGITRGFALKRPLNK